MPAGCGCHQIVDDLGGAHPLVVERNAEPMSQLAQRGGRTNRLSVQIVQEIGCMTLCACQYVVNECHGHSNIESDSLTSRTSWVNPNLALDLEPTDMAHSGYVATLLAQEVPDGVVARLSVAGYANTSRTLTGSFGEGIHAVPAVRMRVRVR
jgi:hypothetical protein